MSATPDKRQRRVIVKRIDGYDACLVVPPQGVHDCAISRGPFGGFLDELVARGALGFAGRAQAVPAPTIERIVAWAAGHGCLLPGAVADAEADAPPVSDRRSG